MTKQELAQKHKIILSGIFSGRLKDAFDSMQELCLQCKNKDLKNQLENHLQTYSNILKYSFEMQDDPEKEKVYRRLQRSVTELADEIREDIVYNNELIAYYRQGRFYSIPETEKAWRDLQKGYDSSEQAKIIFHYLWLTNKYKEFEINLLKEVLDTEKCPWFYKSMIVTAVTLSFWRYFDGSKISALIDFYEKGEDQVWQRALTGMVIGLYLYDNRLAFYPEIIQRLKALREPNVLVENIENSIIQYLKSQETEEITKRMRDEILPEMMKVKTHLEDKLNLDDMISPDPLEENPDWETMFEDIPGVYDKIQEFSELQMEGSDVFHGTFSMLKRFPFFNELSNWFLPFYKEHESVSEDAPQIAEGFDTNQLAEGLEKSVFMCNSDKYSFWINLKHMPMFQQTSMMNLLNEELKAMGDVAKDDKILNRKQYDRQVFSQYFQDLYRFFKLHPLKAEFYDIFEMPFHIHHSRFFQEIFDDKTVIRNIAEFYFERKRFKNALEIFEFLIGEDENLELYEKTGFCYQQFARFEKAVEHYLKAELISPQRPWLLKKIGFCYRKLKDYKKSLEYYTLAEKLEPEDLQVQALLGHNLMDSGEYDQALKHYFKVEYLAPDNHRIQRPVAWCSFMLGNLDNAKKYFKKVISKEGSQDDYMNLGHVEWSLGNKSAAIRHYISAYKKSGKDDKWLLENFEEDSKYLAEKGIPAFDIPLMADYVKLNGRGTE